MAYPDPEFEKFLAERRARGAMEGDDWLRIYHDVLIHNVRQSDLDTPEQARYRRDVAASIDRIRAEGGEPIPTNELP